MKFLLILVLSFLANPAFAAPFYSHVTRGVDMGAGNGGDYFTIEISGGDIHSVHVVGIDATGWTIYDDTNIFSPSWYASSTTGGPGGFSWNISQNKNTAPGDFKFSVPLGEGSNVRLNSSNILVDLVDGTILTTVPIPGAVWLFGSSLIGLLSFNLRKWKKMGS